MVAAAQQRIDAAVEAGRLDEAEAAERTTDDGADHRARQRGIPVRPRRPTGGGRRLSRQPRHDRRPDGTTTTADNPQSPGDVSSPLGRQSQPFLLNNTYNPAEKLEPDAGRGDHPPRLARAGVQHVHAVVAGDERRDGDDQPSSSPA